MPKSFTAPTCLTSVTPQATLRSLKIRNFIHKGLKWLYSESTAKGVPPDTVYKLRKLLAYLDNIEKPAELLALPVILGALAMKRRYFTPQVRSSRQCLLLRCDPIVLDNYLS